jgi:hypothetical protein
MYIFIGVDANSKTQQQEETQERIHSPTRNCKSKQKIRKEICRSIYTETNGGRALLVRWLIVPPAVQRQP